MMPATRDELSRVRWQCRRGMLELDALLGDFVELKYAQLDAGQRACFCRLLEYPDQMLFDYFFGKSIPVDREVADAVEWIRQAVTPQT